MAKKLMGVLLHLLVQTGILAGAAEVASTSSADPRELRCLELCATPDMLKHCFGDEDLDKSYHFCHKIPNDEWEETTPCLEKCLAGDTDPKEFLSNDKLITISKNIVSCSEDAITFPADDLSVTRITKITETFKRCGVVFVPGLLSATTAGNALAQIDAADTATIIRQLLSDPRQAYNPTVFDQTNQSKLPFYPNLRGGRFQIIPDADDTMHRAVVEVTESVIPLVLEKFWQGSKPQLGFVAAVAQGTNTWDQGFHADKQTTEDAQLRIALDDYDKSAGPVEFCPVSHFACHALSRRFWRDSRPTLLAAFRPLVRVPAKAGDAILYSSSTLHQGTATTGSSRTYLVFMMQSTGRRFHADEMTIMTHVSNVKATAVYRALWLSHVLYPGSKQHADAAQRFIDSANATPEAWAKDSEEGSMSEHQKLNLYLIDRVNAQESASKFVLEAMSLPVLKGEL